MNNNIIMDKDDLSTGMLVRFRNGEHCFVVIGAKIYNGPGFDYANVLKTIDSNTTYNLKHYDQNFKFCHPSAPSVVDLDIIQIWAPNDLADIFNKDRTLDNKQLVWEREPDKKEMTIAEIEKALGYSIKIIK